MATAEDNRPQHETHEQRLARLLALEADDIFGDGRWLTELQHELRLTLARLKATIKRSRNRQRAIKGLETHIAKQRLSGTERGRLLEMVSSWRALADVSHPDHFGPAEALRDCALQLEGELLNGQEP